MASYLGGAKLLELTDEELSADLGSDYLDSSNRAVIVQELTRRSLRSLKETTEEATRATHRSSMLFGAVAVLQLLIACFQLLTSTMEMKNQIVAVVFQLLTAIAFVWVVYYFRKTA